MGDKYASGQDAYCYPGSSVLRNKLDIREQDELDQAEMAFTSLRAAALTPSFGPFNLDFLCSLHRYLFQDIYDWAGELRSVDIAKGDTHFCHARFIKAEGDRLMRRLAAENALVNLPLPAFIPRLADHYCELNMLHPFREGNGRALRLFFEQLIINAGYDILWADILPDAWIQANIAGVHGDLAPLIAIFGQAVHELP